MGRLDDAAKRKVVELRKAGLSFRKIKAVLELDNIKVSAQAIYLFLKEFQGKQGKVGPEERGSSTVPQVIAGAGGGRGWRREGWSEQQIRNLLRESSSHAGHAAATEFAKQGGPTPEARAQPSGSGQTSGGSLSLQQQEGEKEDKDIQIISVTSLAQNTQQRGPQSPGTEAGTGSGAPAVTVTGSYMRRRVTPSPAANPMLAARKRLLDKALSHRAKTRESSLQSYQQMASLLRRDQSNVPASDVTRAVPGQPQFDLTTQNRLTQARRSMDGQPGASVPRRMFQQRAGLAVRSAHPPPCVGIRLPNPAVPPTSQVSGPVIRLQTPSSQGLLRRDGNPSPQQVPQEAGGRSGGGGGGLQEQVQSLGSEVHSLSLAVRMLVEQQCRLEREQAQQTQVQKQILSTLQSMASRLGPCNSLQQHTKTPPPLSLPASTSYNQDTFTYSQGTYAQCSQTQPSYNEMGSPSLETMEAFKLTGLNTHGINGFQSCSSANSLPLTHTPTHTLAHTQSYTPAYTQQHAPTHIPSYTQSYAPTYTQSHTHTYRGTESKAPDYPSPSTEGALQDCSASTQMSVNPASPLTISPQDPQLNIIKVETL